jgi:hypothetical protein
VVVVRAGGLNIGVWGILVLVVVLLGVTSDVQGGLSSCMSILFYDTMVCER